MVKKRATGRSVLGRLGPSAIPGHAVLPRAKTVEERLLGVAVLRRTFELRGEGDSPVLAALLPGVLQDLDVTLEQVDAFTRDHAELVDERANAARGRPPSDA